MSEALQEPNTKAPGVCFSSDAPPADGWGLRIGVFARKFCEEWAEVKVHFEGSGPVSLHKIPNQQQLALRRGFREFAKDSRKTVFYSQEWPFPDKGISINHHVHIYIFYLFTYFYFLCMHVCMYVCTYVRMYVCTYVRMYVCMYECMYVCVYVCICMYVCMYVCTYVRMYVCTYVRMYVCTYVRMYVCTYVRMYVCMYYIGLWYFYVETFMYIYILYIGSTIGLVEFSRT